MGEPFSFNATRESLMFPNEKPSPVPEMPDDSWMNTSAPKLFTLTSSFNKMLQNVSELESTVMSGIGAVPDGNNRIPANNQADTASGRIRKAWGWDGGTAQPATTWAQRQERNQSNIASARSRFGENAPGRVTRSMSMSQTGLNPASPQSSATYSRIGGFKTLESKYGTGSSWTPSPLFNDGANRQETAPVSAGFRDFGDGATTDILPSLSAPSAYSMPTGTLNANTFPFYAEQDPNQYNLNPQRYQGNPFPNVNTLLGEPKPGELLY